MSVYILWSYGAATWSHMSVYLLWGCHLILSRNCGFNWHFTEHVPNLYYKSWNNWKRFSPRLGPPYPSRRSHLSGQKDWRKGGGDWFRQCFSPKSYYFLHQQFLIPTSCTHILLSFSAHILSFAHKLTHNSRHFLFSKDNNWHHCLWKENKEGVLTYYFPLVYTYFSLHIS